jgi:hypothetical protein
MAARALTLGLPELPADSPARSWTDSRRFRGSARMAGGGKRVGHAMEPEASLVENPDTERPRSPTRPATRRRGKAGHLRTFPTLVRLALTVTSRHQGSTVSLAE